MKILCKFLTKFSKFLTKFKQSVNFQGFAKCGVCACDLLALAQIHTLQAVRFCYFKKGVNLNSVSKNGKFHSFLTIDCRANFAYLLTTTFYKISTLFKKAPFQKSVDFRQSPTFVILSAAKNPRIYGNALNLWILRLLRRLRMTNQYFLKKSY